MDRHELRDDQLAIIKPFVSDGRKRALGTRRPMILPNGINERWSLDFVSDGSRTAVGSAYWLSLMIIVGSA